MSWRWDTAVGVWKPFRGGAQLPYSDSKHVACGMKEYSCNTSKTNNVSAMNAGSYIYESSIAESDK